MLHFVLLIRLVVPENEHMEALRRIQTDKSAKISLEIGLDHMGRSEFPEALRNLNQAIRIKPNYSDAYVSRGAL